MSSRIQTKMSTDQWKTLMSTSVWLNLYRSGQWTSFEEFVLWQKSCWLVSPLISCTCPIGLKEYTCKHSVGLAIIQGIYDVTDQTRCQPLGKRKGKGLRKKVRTALFLELPFFVNNKYGYLINVFLVIISQLDSLVINFLLFGDHFAARNFGDQYTLFLVVKSQLDIFGDQNSTFW